jgi:hypothetical protein
MFVLDFNASLYEKIIGVLYCIGLILIVFIF